MESYTDIKSKLKEKGFKVTPQRVYVMEAMSKLNHPTADHVLEYVRSNLPDVGTGTVYQTLDAFVRKRMIQKIRTDGSVMRYELITGRYHHHLYCSECDMIEDYMDDELNQILTEYFRKKNIKNFSIKDIRLQIAGRFTDERLDENGVCLAAKKAK